MLFALKGHNSHCIPTGMYILLFSKTVAARTSYDSQAAIKESLQ